MTLGLFLASNAYALADSYVLSETFTNGISASLSFTSSVSSSHEYIVNSITSFTYNGETYSQPSLLTPTLGLTGNNNDPNIIQVGATPQDLTTFSITSLRLSPISFQTYNYTTFYEYIRPIAGPYAGVGSSLAGLYKVTDTYITYDSSLPGYFSSYSVNKVTPVPEQAEWTMMLLGLPIIGGVVRRKQSLAAVV